MSDSDNILNLNKFGDLLKNARRVQEQMEKTQKELSSVEVTGEAGGGMVRIALVGGRQARSTHIDPSLLTDPEMLQDLITAAITDALRKSEAVMGEKMQHSLTGALQPGQSGQSGED